MRAVFPGSFDPLTVAHLAIAEAARATCGATTVDLAISRVALAKEDRAGCRVEERVAAIERAAELRPWLGVVVTDLQLVSDIAEPYDLVIVGADKWAQLHDVSFHPSEEHLAAALAKLPAVVVVPRPPHPTPDHLRLDVPGYEDVSSSAIRAGDRPDWLAPEAEWPPSSWRK